jgi:hypothetical protein
VISTVAHPRSFRPRRQLFALAILVLLGLGAFAGTKVGARHESKAEHVAPPIPAAQAPLKPVVLPSTVTVPGLTGATPTLAVTKFLDAEIAGDYDASLAYLIDTERAQAGAPEVWKAAHGQLPHYTSYKIDAPTGDGRVVTTVHYEPRLDEIVGFTPGAATVTWAANSEADGYRVSLIGTTVQAVLPADAAAPKAALAWAQSRQQCQTTNQYVGNLLGQPDVAQGLCHVGGSFSASGATPLATFADTTAITNAFGGDADRFTRVVTLHGPSELKVVVAPLGDEWVVVGVAAA